MPSLLELLMKQLQGDPGIASDPEVQRAIAQGGGSAPVETGASTPAAGPIAPQNFMKDPGLASYISGWQKYLTGGGQPEGAVAGSSRVEDFRQQPLGQGLPSSVRRNDVAGNPRAGQVYDTVVQPDGTVSHVYYGLKRGDSPLVVRLRDRALGQGQASPTMGAAGDTGGAAAPGVDAGALAAGGLGTLVSDELRRRRMRRGARVAGGAAGGAA